MAHPKSVVVYDNSTYGQDVFLPINLQSDATTTFLETSITCDASGTAYVHYPDSNSAGKVTPTDDNDMVLAANNTILLVGLANNTAFSRTFSWTPDMNAMVYKTSLQIAVGINCSAFSAGTVSLGSVQIKAVERNTLRVLIDTLTFPDLTTALTGTGTNIAIIQADWNVKYPVYSTSPIDITLTINSTKSATATFQSGVFPVFCWSKTNNFKAWSMSGVKFHIHATPDHADPVFDLDADRLSPLGQVNTVV